MQYATTALPVQQSFLTTLQMSHSLKVESSKIARGFPQVLSEIKSAHFFSQNFKQPRELYTDKTLRITFNWVK